MTLNEILTKDGRSLNSITKIYRGRDNYCRCGCGGVYHKTGSKGLIRAINRMNKPDFTPSAEVEYGDRYINIPYDSEKDLCYCVYFD